MLNYRKTGNQNKVKNKTKKYCKYKYILNSKTANKGN